MALVESVQAREPQRPHYDDVAYWSSHPAERAREFERIAGALRRCWTPEPEIEAAIQRVRKVMAGG
jgi:hypothetical protein